MPYGMSTARARGDPFLGGIIKGIGKVAGGFLTGGPLGAIGAGVGLIRGAPSQPQIMAAAMPGGAMMMRQGKQRRSPLSGARLGKLEPTRKRMNYSNQKALRRALRRATGYARQQKAVRKAASEFAREFGPRRSAPRRDVGRGHVHVR